MFEGRAAHADIDGLGCRCGELRLRLTDIESCRHASAITVARDIECTPQGGDIVVEQTALCLRHTQGEIGADQRAAQTEFKGRKIGFTGRRIGARLLDTAAHASPQIDFPSNGTRQPRERAGTGTRTGGNRITAVLRAAATRQLHIGRHARQLRGARALHRSGGRPIAGLGSREVLIVDRHFVDQGIERRIAIGPPPLSARHCIGLRRLPVTGFFVHPRRRDRRALIIRAERAGAEQPCAAAAQQRSTPCIYPTHACPPSLLRALNSRRRDSAKRSR